MKRFTVFIAALVLSAPAFAQLVQTGRPVSEIVEMEQAAHDAQGGDWNNEVFPPIRELRAVLERCGAPA